MYKLNYEFNSRGHSYEFDNYRGFEAHFMTLPHDEREYIRNNCDLLHQAIKQDEIGDLLKLLGREFNCASKNSEGLTSIEFAKEIGRQDLIPTLSQSPLIIARRRGIGSRDSFYTRRDSYQERGYQERERDAADYMARSMPGLPGAVNDDRGEALGTLDTNELHVALPGRSRAKPVHTPLEGILEEPGVTSETLAAVSAGCAAEMVGGSPPFPTITESETPVATLSAEDKQIRRMSALSLSDEPWAERVSNQRAQKTGCCIVM